ncbi:hypothetical protein ACOI1H_02595 [Loktanella sp. DJP18]|uniref:hypothetical protein n=1 Tax=Loktanella sp. DJP18 TaxID=3409788 RepID=UPI003BB5189E
MIRSLAVVTILALGACTQQVPDSGRAAVAPQAASARDAQLSASTTTTFAAPTPLAASALPPMTDAGQNGRAVESSELAALGIGAPVGLAQDQAMQQPIAAAPPATNNTGLSDEQSFEAVSNRETIESDAQRRAQQAAARQVVMPSALPDRPADTGPNIVQYAISAPNRLGQEWYSRSIFATQGKFQRNCATYNSPDAAQRDFLARGGPEKDSRGLDPDGDGFACGWDPAPFLLAAGN